MHPLFHAVYNIHSTKTAKNQQENSLKIKFLCAFEYSTASVQTVSSRVKLITLGFIVQLWVGPGGGSTVRTVGVTGGVFSKFCASC